jgi:hypothetical protein
MKFISSVLAPMVLQAAIMRVVVETVALVELVLLGPLRLMFLGSRPALRILFQQQTQELMLISNRAR